MKTSNTSVAVLNVMAILLALNIMLHCNKDKTMPEIIAIPLAVVLLVGAIAFTLIFFRGNDE